MCQKPPSSSSPLRLVIIGQIITICMFALMGWYGWNMFRAHERVQTEGLVTQQRLSGTIMHLDEVLTMSARMATATGDLAWEERYWTFEPQLGEAIEQLIAMAPEAYEQEATSQTDAANIRLVAMEEQAFEHVRQGRLDEASVLLFSQEYEEQKRIYAEGMDRFTASLRQQIETRSRTLRLNLFRAGEIIIGCLLVLMVGWIVVTVMLGRHMTERRRAEEEREGLLRDLGDTYQFAPQAANITTLF